MKDLYFISYFSKEYVLQGLVSVKSFKFFHPSSYGFIICLDEFTLNYLRSMNFDKKIKIIDLREISTINNIFNYFLKSRTRAESIISIKPILIEEFITQIPIESILVYFDADIFFYQSFSRIDNLFIENDVILSKHLFPPALAGSEIYGKYNGGLIFFKNSKKSLNYLSTWRQLCIDWCELKIDRNRFADQKYLERFEFNSGVYALVDPGINLGQQYFVDRKIKIKKLNTNILMVDGFQLIAFHFHGFKIGKYFFNTGFNRYAPLKNRIKIFLFIYRPYIGSIRRELRQLKQNIQLDSESILYRDPHFRFYQLIFQVLKFSKVISFGKN